MRVVHRLLGFSISLRWRYISGAFLSQISGWIFVVAKLNIFNSLLSWQPLFIYKLMYHIFVITINTFIH